MWMQPIKPASVYDLISDNQMAIMLTMGDIWLSSQGGKKLFLFV